MAVDYDLVIIGSSVAGIYAAKKAVQLQARVALVTQSDCLYLPNSYLFNYSLGTVGKFQNILKNDFGMLRGNSNDLSLSNTEDWIEDTNLAVQNLNSLPDLAALGVDVIVGKGKFSKSPHLELKVKQRCLRARRFLLATGTNCVPNFMENSDLQNYLTLKDLPEQKLFNLPINIVIIGSNPTALALAQNLVNFGKEVTLIAEQNRILPQEDNDISILIQAQLEAIGVKILTQSHVSQIKVIDRQKWLQVGDRAISADEIIVANHRQPNIAGLNLAGIDVKYDARRVYVNEKLETTNKNISACGELIGGYSLPNIAQYEANIILKNTLFFPRSKVDYHTLPWAILTQPSLARVGLNEKQARQKYDKIHVIRQYFSEVGSAPQVSNVNSGVCKLIVGQQGDILGCSIFGDRASELITIPALMMQHRIRLDRNPMRGLTSVSIPYIYPDGAEIIARAIDCFYQQKIQSDPKLLNRLRSWFSWRKS